MGSQGRQIEERRRTGNVANRPQDQQVVRIIVQLEYRHVCQACALTVRCIHGISLESGFIVVNSQSHSGGNGGGHAIVIAVAKSHPGTVPFILRVVQPLSKDYKLKAQPVDNSELGVIGKMKKLYEWLAGGNAPLCWPADLESAFWADQLFYQPHNSWHLMDVQADNNGDPNKCYAFGTEDLKGLIKQFHDDLTALDADLAKNYPGKHFVLLSEIANSIQY